MASLGGGGHDVMANLAARLMGRRAATNQPTQPVAIPAAAAAAPRTLPTPQVQAVETARQTPPRQSPTPASSESVRRRDVVAQTTNGTAAPPPSRTTIQSAPIVAQEDEEVSTVDANRGPSLFGTADQLATAREFLQSASTSRTRSRGGRSRVVSTERSCSGTRSPRTPAAAPLARSGGYPPLSTAPRVGPSTRSQTGSLPDSPARAPSRSETAQPAAIGYTALQGRPSTTHSQPEIKAWNTYGAKPAENKGTEAIEAVTKSLEKIDIGSTGLSTPSPNKKADPAKPAKAWQMTDVTNTLAGRASEVRSPPHVRDKSANPVVDSKLVAKVGTASNPIIIDVDNKGVNNTTNGVNGAVNGAAITEIQPLSKPTVSQSGASSRLESKPLGAANTFNIFKVTEDKPSGKLTNDYPAPIKGSDITPSLTNGVSTSGSAAATSTTSNHLDSDKDTMLKMMELLRKELAALNERLKALEHENFVLQKQLDAMLQAEERRKYLGTDSAKVPFVIEVHLPSGQTENIQVTTELKISALIRRVRNKANLSPEETMNPRITVEGTQVGHGMTLYEVGVRQNEKKDIMFKYDVTA